MKLFLIVTLFAFTSTGHSQTKNLNSDFQDAWVLDYKPLACSDNVIRLYQRFERPKNSWVLHIFHNSVPYVSISPRHPRRLEGVFLPTRWVFHAVLLVDGKVYDLDYKDEPTPINTESYLESMWDPEALEHEYRFQIKRAQDYTTYDADGDMAGLEKLRHFEVLNVLSQ